MRLTRSLTLILSYSSIHLGGLIYAKPAIFHSPPTKKRAIASSMPVVLLLVFLLSRRCEGCLFFIFLAKILGPLFLSYPLCGGVSVVAPMIRRNKEILFSERPLNHAVAGNAITSACFVASGAKVTRCACAILCSRRKCP